MQFAAIIQTAVICLEIGDLPDGDREGDIVVGHAAPREQELVLAAVAANVKTAARRQTLQESNQRLPCQFDRIMHGATPIDQKNILLC